MNEKLKAFERLLGVMDDLREKCPWDKKQTLESLRNLTIEETYELADAILVKDMQGIKEELGDIMLHLVFYAKIASETNDFTIADVMNSVCDKLIYRHPHIYGDIKVNGEDEVKENWEKLKLKEGKKSILSGVPNSLPSLVKAFRIQDKAKQVGFEWEHLDQVWDKVQEENTEFVEAVSDFKKDPSKFDKMEEEYGDLLFALVNYARFLKVEPETALERCNKKFISRFQYIEKAAKRTGQILEEMSLEEMDALWNEAKVHET